jgi:phospholipase/carboxylesterase
MIARLPKSALRGVVMLHGRGGSGADILSLLDHAGLTEVAAVAPEAQANSWWPTSFLAPESQVAPFVEAGLNAVTEAVSKLHGHGLPLDAIWLCGFSQGACLALEAYARHGKSLAGVIGLSGGLVGLADSGAPDPDLYGHRDKAMDYGTVLSGKVRISVHEKDPHIPLKRVRQSAEAFALMGAEVETVVHPGQGHAILRDDLVAMCRLVLPA